MAILRKEILLFKIQKAIKENSFVLFFQHNNVKYKEWILLKNSVLGLKDTNMLVCKNNLTNVFQANVNRSKKFEIVNLTRNLDNLKQFKDIATNTANKPVKKELIRFLCQGPTIIITTNSVYNCRNICDILSVTGCAEDTTVKSYFTFKHTHKIPESLSEYWYDTINSTAKIAPVDKHCNIAIPLGACAPSALESKLFLKPLFLKQKFPGVFKQKKKSIDLCNTENLICSSAAANDVHSTYAPRALETAMNQETINIKKNTNFLKNKIFFVGGLAQNQMIDSLDLKNFCKLDDSVHTALITTLHNSVESLVAVPICAQIAFLHCLILGNELSSLPSIQTRSKK